VREDQEVPDESLLTAPLQLPDHGPGGSGRDEPAEVAVERDTTASTEVDPGPVRAFGQEVERLSGLVAQLGTLAATLGDRLDGEVRKVLDDAERALAEASGARKQSLDADARAA
jgi:hypothetical protein